ncbi:hypothetical protein M9H77_02153 [Catharanthus roseus]|uniref:Uncharacterized protein n=1 Tax=Catharanthus roseus TaxID=4058 RepID=A0ACC0C7L5_CATRO|nr:hypothetical protein M9H77_02153 [Catharanthus roseus]
MQLYCSRWTQPGENNSSPGSCPGWFGRCPNRLPGDPDLGTESSEKGRKYSKGMSDGHSVSSRARVFSWASYKLSEGFGRNQEVWANQNTSALSRHPNFQNHVCIMIDSTDRVRNIKQDHRNKFRYPVVITSLKHTAISRPHESRSHVSKIPICQAKPHDL